MKLKKVLAMLAATAGVFCLAVTASAEESGVLSDTQTNTANESVVPKNSPVITGNPFTPNGTGTVVDNATDSDGKEFYTIATEDGNIFYFVIDRSRGSENVYFLNAVTEADLKSLAADGNIKKASTVAALEQDNTVQNTTDSDASQNSNKTDNDTDSNSGGDKSGSGSGKGTDFDMSTILIIALGVVIAGGAGFLKLRKSKGKKNDDEDEDTEDYDKDDFDDYDE